MTRQEIDARLDNIYNGGDNVLLTWATGCGKSRAAIRYINKFDNPEARYDVLVCVAEIAHINNWHNEFASWGTFGLNVRIDVVCYASLKSMSMSRYDLVILDECHHIATDIREDALSRIEADRVIALSATVDRDTRDCLNRLYGRFVEFNITLQDAIDWDILPTPRIYTIPLSLRMNGSDERYVFTRGNSKKRKRIVCDAKDRWIYLRDKKGLPDLELHVRCSQFEKYCYITEAFEYARKQYFALRNDALKNRWLQQGSERKRFLSSIKTAKARVLINILLDDSRHIVFCGDIEQADKLGCDNAVHSKRENPKDIIDRFNQKKTNSLYCVGMLQEGQNLTDIEKALIIQLDGNERSFIQRLGRVLRAERPVIYIMYVEGTRDEEFLKDALEGINPGYVKTLRYDEIFNRHRRD